MSIRVLIVDDSAITRQLLQSSLSRDSGIEVIGTAPDAYVARDKIVELRPDVITLDIEMPRMDGITFLRKLMRYHPLPVVVVSSLTPRGGSLALEAMAAGAVDVVPKPEGESLLLQEFIQEVTDTIKAAACVRLPSLLSPVVRPLRHPAVAAAVAQPLVLVGASTGGTQALQFLLKSLPAPVPAMAVVQHMPEQFTRSFAERLDAMVPHEVKEAEDGDALVPGRVLIAPGDRHMLIAPGPGQPHVRIRTGPRVSRHRPSVDVLFKSAAQAGIADLVAVLLTGMGRDGAEGMQQLKKAGARTVAQDEQSCVVFGMPKEAIALDAVQHVLPLEKIPLKLLELAWSPVQ